MDKDETMYFEDLEPMGEGNVHLRYSIGGDEMEVEGPPQFADKHAALFLTTKYGDGNMRQLDFFGNVDTLLLPETDSDVSEQINGNGYKLEEQPIDLASFYTTKAPKSQRDQLLVIAYHYCPKDEDVLSLDDFRTAYAELRRMEIDPPADLANSVNTLVRRKAGLYKNDGGLFGITDRGRRRVEQLEKDD